jgi:hypothetical protein
MRSDDRTSLARLSAPLRGRLMVGRLTLDQVVGVRVPAPQPERAHRAELREKHGDVKKSVNSCVDLGYAAMDAGEASCTRLAPTA